MPDSIGPKDDSRSAPPPSTETFSKPNADATLAMLNALRWQGMRAATEEDLDQVERTIDGLRLTPPTETEAHRSIVQRGNFTFHLGFHVIEGNRTLTLQVQLVDDPQGQFLDLTEARFNLKPVGDGNPLPIELRGDTLYFWLADNQREYVFTQH